MSSRRCARPPEGSATPVSGPPPLRLVFLGTRGEIELRTPAHALHSALLLDAGSGAVMIDCGLDWEDRVGRVAPEAIVLTHAHPDHAGGLRRGAPCAVYATEDTWKAIARYGVRERRRVTPGERLELCGLALEAFPLEHSLRAPAVGYRVGAGSAGVFYAPDVVAIGDPAGALGGVDLYVGDGASVTRSIVRRRDGRPIGHASIRVQLGWCETAGVPRALFTHCGTQVVRQGAAALARVVALGEAAGVRAELAADGLEVVLAAGT